MRTNPGVDRQKVHALRRVIATCTTGQHQHEAGCWTCQRAGSDVYGKCAAWWNLVRALHQARRALALYEAAGQDAQTPLPGMETYGAPG
jgi:hypothetical protein